MITPFTLPSNPSVHIQLREATVSDAIDFADVDESHEEELTTLYLNRVQVGSSILDPRDWTAEDRRFALYWYWLHTTRDHDIALTYECQHCGKKHTYMQDMGELANLYTPIEGAAERSAVWKDEAIAVRPLTGRDMENIEKKALAFGLTPGMERKKTATMMLDRVVMSVTFGNSAKSGQNRGSDDSRKKILAMAVDEFTDFAEIVSNTLLEMKHGLDMVHDEGRVYLLMPPHTCPEGGGQTRLRYPFWNNDYIPSLW